MKPHAAWAVLGALAWSMGPGRTNGHAQETVQALERLRTGEFEWRASGPLVAPRDRPGDDHFSVKDPTVVHHEGRWHLFCTIRAAPRSHRIEYLSFEDWDAIADARRVILDLTPGYFCAPQVFRFTPQRKWYLIYQVADESRKPALQPAFSTTDDLSDPASWTAPELLFEEMPGNVSGWIDFWVICDDAKAHLFFTSLDGRMWRSEAPRDAFPHGWSAPEVVLTADIFEASHTYRLKGQDRYLTVVEAQGEGRRYYKAYLADRLEGPWEPLADAQDRPFAGKANVRFDGPAWADSISHVELLRDGSDERLVVDPDRLRVLFQGASDREYRGNPYGKIPWRLGLLEPIP